MGCISFYLYHLIYFASLTSGQRVSNLNIYNVKISLPICLLIIMTQIICISIYVYMPLIRTVKELIYNRIRCMKLYTLIK
jgi:hypothetical protein